MKANQLFQSIIGNYSIKNIDIHQPLIKKKSVIKNKYNFFYKGKKVKRIII